MGAIGPGDDERDTAMRDLLAKLPRGAGHAVQRQGSGDETRDSSRHHAGARCGALFLREPHPTDVPPQRPGHAIGESLGVIAAGVADRKSTRLNSSHANISYAVVCLIKKI